MTRSLAAPLSLALVAAAVTTAASCGGTTDTTPAEAVILIDREIPDGGQVLLPAALPNTVQSEQFQILNLGRATMTVTGASVRLIDGGTPGAGFPFSQPQVTVDGGGAPDALPVLIGGIGSLPGGERPRAFLQFTYSPKAIGRTDGLLVINSSAPARPRVVVPLSVCAPQADGGGC